MVNFLQALLEASSTQQPTHKPKTPSLVYSAQRRKGFTFHIFIPFHPCIYGKDAPFSGLFAFRNVCLSLSPTAFFSPESFKSRSQRFCGTGILLLLLLPAKSRLSCSLPRLSSFFGLFVCHEAHTKKLYALLLLLLIGLLIDVGNYWVLIHLYKTKHLDIYKIRGYVKLQLFVFTKFAKNNFTAFQILPFLAHLTPKTTLQNSILTRSAQHKLGVICLFNFFSFYEHFFFPQYFKYFLANAIREPIITLSNPLKPCQRPFKQSLFLF